jgi:hypothetical protein
VPLSDEELLGFDESLLARYERGQAIDALKRHGDSFRYQLVAARWTEEWADRLENDPAFAVANEYQSGYVRALREVTAHLRQGDFLPGAMIYEETTRA